MVDKPIKTYTFMWHGINKQGKSVSGEYVAASANILKSQLRKQGIETKKIYRKISIFGQSIKDKITSQQITRFSRQLATMLEAGIPILNALDILGRGHINAEMKVLLLAIKADIEAGSRFAEALAKHSQYFDKLYCNVISIGEEAGLLDAMLLRIAEHREKLAMIKSRVKRAMIYPAALLAIAAMISLVLIMFVVPQFEAIFKSFGAELPAFTRLVLDAAWFLKTFWWLFVVAVVLTVWWYKRKKHQSQRFRDSLDQTKLRLPIVGAIIEQAALARFSHTLVITVTAGIPITDALQCVARTVENNIYRVASLQIREDILKGSSLHEAMHNTGLFPSMVIQMVSVGEEAGSLEDMLSRIADFFEAEVDESVDKLTSLIEPAVMAFLGVFIGGLIAAMYLPVFDLGQVI